jgi:hypothetical protein
LTRCGTNGPASCAKLRGCSETYSQRRESHWEGYHRWRPKGKTGVWAGRLTGADRRQAVVGWAMARKVLFIGVHSWSKWVTAGACTRVRSVLCAGHTRVHAAVEQGQARLVAGGASVKETRSCTTCLFRLSRRVRWLDAERRRPHGSGARGRGGVGRTHACAHCPDIGVRAELDGIPWPRRPRGSGLTQQGR